jgi:outer membrane lipoprotein-sorting protein
MGTAPALAVNPNETDARKIMQAVNDQPTGDKATGRMAMQVEDSAGRTRTRSVQTRSIKFAGGSKRLMIFESPADVRNTGLLSIDYDDGNKSDDQWLYLPSLRKSTRIASSDKSGSFMGTDLSYSDMTKSDISHYDYRIVKASTVVGGDDCWVIEARPNTQRAKDETGYVKSHIWVSKSKLIPLQIKAWIREGRKIKQIKFAGVEKIDGIWFARKILARTLRGGKVESVTRIKFTTMKFNQSSVSEADFTERRLEQGL